MNTYRKELYIEREKDDFEVKEFNDLKIGSLSILFKSKRGEYQDHILRLVKGKLIQVNSNNFKRVTIYGLNLEANDRISAFFADVKNISCHYKDGVNLTIVKTKKEEN